jgi:alginate O-acetyltransferase complex protein AlgI
MLFNSVRFALFLTIVFLLYWFIVQRSTKKQNLLLLAASLLFYGCWDWRFLFLLCFTIGLDFIAGIRIHEAENDRSRKAWLYASVGINLGLLMVFKYFNFFSESFAGFAEMLGFRANPVLMQIVLPVGISFYTFHGLSYVFDIYRKKFRPTYDPVNYALFVSFFPLLVAGPIERAWHLLPQIEKPRTFDYAKATDGLRQILWGLFKKIVIADSCAPDGKQPPAAHWW